jgi:hypothetical protein
LAATVDCSGLLDALSAIQKSEKEKKSQIIFFELSNNKMEVRETSN